jgi:hypothetical protein
MYILEIPYIGDALGALVDDPQVVNGCVAFQSGRIRNLIYHHTSLEETCAFA